MPYISTIADTINPQRLKGLDFSSSGEVTKEEYGIGMTFEGMKRNWWVTLNTFYSIRGSHLNDY